MAYVWINVPSEPEKPKPLKKEPEIKNEIINWHKDHLKPVRYKPNPTEEGMTWDMDGQGDIL